MSDNSIEKSSRIMPRWAVAVVALQSLTLLAVIAGRPAAPDAAAQNYRSGRSAQQQGLEDPAPQGSTLPNAADQRREQIRLLGLIVDELGKTNQKLDALNENLKDDAPAQPNG